MEDEKESINNNSGIVCFRCPKTIKVGEPYVSVSISIEAPTKDGQIQVLDSCALCQLCFGCAGVLLTEDAITKNMLSPTSLLEVCKEVKRRCK